jgi:hypothetical protein
MNNGSMRGHTFRKTVSCPSYKNSFPVPPPLGFQFVNNVQPHILRFIHADTAPSWHTLEDAATKLHNFLFTTSKSEKLLGASTQLEPPVF